MTKNIKKIQFKPDADLQIEVVDLDTLTNNYRDELVKPHRTNFYHIFIFDDCYAEHIVDFKTVTIKPKSLLFIDKNRVHHFDPKLNYKGHIIIFTEDFFATTEADSYFLRSSQLFNTFSDQSIAQLPLSELAHLLQITQSIKNELNKPFDQTKATILKKYLHLFLLIAERELKQLDTFKHFKGADWDYSLQFRIALDNRFKDFKSVNDYAKLLFISEKRLTQATNKALGQTPKEMITERIQLEAKRLLVHTHLSIKEIGQDLGFEDPAYFVRFFKKHEKITPVSFRAGYFLK